MTKAGLIPMNGGKVSSRELRRRLNAEADFVQGQVAPAVNAALQNEQATRKRVDALEMRVDGHSGRLDSAENVMLGHLTRSFWGRLSWVIRGR